MTRDCTITLDDEQYEAFQDQVEQSDFDTVAEYIERLCREYYDYQSTTNQETATGSSAGRDLDSHLESLGYK